MESLRELFRIGNGPSSSHTMGPKFATIEFLDRYGKMDLDFIEVYLYGSLALTGKGHLTDKVIDETLKDYKHEIIFDPLHMVKHPNTMMFKGYKNDKYVAGMIAKSVGGGKILINKEKSSKAEPYKLKDFESIKEYCKKKNYRLSDYVDECEPDITDYLKDVMKAMNEAIDRGLKSEGVIPGDLELDKKAKAMYLKEIEDEETKRVMSYAFAVNEENASGGIIVTAPTCGACGVMPAVLRYAMDKGKSESDILRGLKVAGLIGNLLKTNASISGAVAGCQAEVGSACSMGAAFISEVYNEDIETIEKAAEIALEHHLGLTCDPVGGYVQIPCIERNAAAAMRSIDAYKLAKLQEGLSNRVSFDLICLTMLTTGKDLLASYRETSKGGLAKYKKQLKKAKKAKKGKLDEAK